MRSNIPDFSPNKSDLTNFLDMFSGLHTFQTFDEAKNGSGVSPKIIHGWSNSTFASLSRYNDQGAGVFFLVNESDGQGRKNEHIVKVRAVFLDLDGSPLKPVLDTGVIPHIVVESSPSKYHVYWLIDDCELNQFKTTQMALAARFDGDKSVNDLCRVLRIPGFYHQKKEPFLTRILELNNDLPAYSLEHLSERLGLQDIMTEPTGSSGKAPKFKSPERVGEGHRNDTMFRFICSNFARGFSEEANLAAAVAENNCKYDPPLPSDELLTIFESAKKRRNPTAGAAKAVTSFIEELNKEYFVAQDAGRTSVFHEHYNHELGIGELVRYGIESFKQFHNRERVEVEAEKGTKVVRKGSAWIDSHLRRQYDGIILAPPGMKCPDRYYNLWSGYGVKPEKGNWRLLKRHLYEVICGKNRENFHFLMLWLANCVQNPSKPAEVAVVLRGKKGIGKGILGNAMCKLFGGNSLHITNARHLVGNFNSHLRGCIFLFADESFFAGDKQHESVQKGLITEPTIPIEGKGVDLIEVRNMLHIMMASNSDWVVPASVDERRYFVLDVSDNYRNDPAYFKRLLHELESGGLAAMLHELLEFDLEGFDIRDIPQTDALLDQKLRSLDPLRMWWYQILKEGKLPEGEAHKDRVGDTVAAPMTFQGTWDNVCNTPENRTPRVPCAVLYESYRRDTSRPLPNTTFGSDIKKLLPLEYPKRRLHGGQSKQVWYYEFPDLDVCRKHFSELIGADIDWE